MTMMPMLTTVMMMTMVTMMMTIMMMTTTSGLICVRSIGGEQIELHQVAPDHHHDPDDGDDGDEKGGW